MLAREFRLRKKSEFKQGYAKGRVARGRFAVIYYLPSAEPEKRFGLVVSGKIGPAVVRNRIKRRFREIARGLLPEIKTGSRVILAARTRAREGSFAEIAAEIGRLLHDLGAIDSSEPCFGVKNSTEA